MNRLLPMLLLLAAAPCFGAEFTVEAKGSVYANDGTKQDVVPSLELTAAADPLWGHTTQSDLENTVKKTKQEYPTVTVAGSGTSDAKGYFKFNITIVVPEGKTLPMASDGANPPSWYEYVFVKLDCNLEGYRQSRRNILLYIGKENHAQNVYLERIPRIKGRLLSLDKMKALADTTVVIRQKIMSGRMDQEPPTWKLVTDAKGNFDLNDPNGPIGTIELALEDPALAFASSSVAWKDHQLRNGDNDLGNLMVVPGCSLKLRVLESVEKKQVSVTIDVKSSDGKLTLMTPARTGEYERSGLPEGTYVIEIITGAYFGKTFENVVLKAGVNDLGEILVDPQLTIFFDFGVDKGQAPASASATAILLEGTPPQKANKWGNNYRYSGTVSSKYGNIAQLFKGRWFVMVTANGWAPFWIEVELPMEGKLKVTLTLGGSMELNVATPDGKPAEIDWAAIAVPGTPAESWLRECDDNRLDIGNSSEPAGLLYSNGGGLARNPNGGTAYKPGPLPAGKYLLRAKTSTGMIQKDIEIKAGEHLALNVSPDPGRIEITVTRDGKPAPNEKLFLTTVNYFNRNSETVTEGQTDAKGVFTQEFTQATNLRVLLKREQEWVSAAPNDYEKAQRTEALADRTFMVVIGAVVKLAIDAGGRERTWLTVELDLDEGYSVDSAILVAQLGRSQSAGLYTNGSVDGIKVVFAMLRPGNYWLSANLKTETNARVTAIVSLRAEAKAEQTVKVKVRLHEVSVTVKLPAGALADRAQISICSKPEWPMSARYFASTNDNQKGKYTFQNVPAGDYDVVASVPGKDGTFTYYGYESVNVKGSTKTKVTVSDNQGSLNISLRNVNASPLPDSMPKSARVTFFDKNMVQVTTGFPASAFGQPGSINVQGVPAGTYTVRIESTGCKTWQGEVKIEKGTATTLSISMETAAVIRLGISPEHVPAVLAQDFTLRLESADGKQLPDTGLNLSNLFLEFTSQGKATLCLASVDSNAKRLRLKLKGCKEIVLEMSLTDGATFDATPTLEKE